MLSRNTKVFVTVFFLLLLGIWICFFSGFYTQKERKDTFIIDGTQAFYDLPFRLEERGIIRSAKALKILLRLTGVDKRVHLGYYEFSNQMNLVKVLLNLKEGKILTTKVTVVEGFDLYDIDGLLAKKGIIPSMGGFIEAIGLPKWRELVEKKLGLKGLSSLEGFFYPNTYQIPLGAGVDSFIQAALDYFEKEVYRRYKNVPPQQFYTHLIKASLIEKETVAMDEKPLVASVIDNRMGRRQKLEMDSTVIYMIKKNNLVNSSLKEGKINIRREHFFMASPYNTYYTKNLPPTPICNPTLSSIEATFKPARTSYYYFVADPKTGRHTFSNTFEEHRERVARYVLEKKKMRLAEKKSSE